MALRGTAKTLHTNLVIGSASDFAGKKLEAALVRKVLLGIGIDSAEIALRSAAQSMLHVCNATFSERLNLSDISGAGGGFLPALLLEGCHFARGLTLDHSRFAKLILKNCTFGPCDDEASIDLRGADFADGVSFDALQAAEPGGPMWCDAPDSTIGGNFWILNTHFQVPPRRDLIPTQKPYRFGLSLARAKIGGSITSWGGVAAIGGINLCDAVVENDVWLSGVRIERGESPQALTAQAARIGGSLMLSVLPRIRPSDDLEYFRVIGQVWLWGVSVRNSISLTGARIWSDAQLGGEAALVLSNSNIGLNLDIGGNARIFGAMFLDGCTVTGGCIFGPCEIGIRPDSWWIPISMERLSCLKSVRFQGVTPLTITDWMKDVQNRDDHWWQSCRDWIERREAEPALLVRSRLDSVDHRLKNRANNGIDLSLAKVGRIAFAAKSEFTERNEIVGGILAEETECEGSFQLAALVIGDISLKGMTVRGGSLELQELEQVPYGGRGATPKFDMSNIDVAKSIQVSSLDRKLPGPMAVRAKPLTCLPGKTLVEVLWSGDHVRMSGHIVEAKPGILDLGTRREITTLDGTSRWFHNWNAQGKLQIQTVEQARELLLLFTAYLHGEGGSFRIVETPDQLGPFELDPDMARAERETVMARLETFEGSDVDKVRAQAELDARLSMSKDQVIASLAPLKITQTEDGFEAEATVHYENHLFKVIYAIGRQLPTPSLVEMVDDYQISPPLHSVVVFNGRTISRRKEPISSSPLNKETDVWPLEPTLPAMEVLAYKDWRRLGIESHGPGSAEISDARIILNDAQCDTLNDSGGQAWGGNNILELDRFTYRHAEPQPRPAFSLDQSRVPLWREMAAKLSASARYKINWRSRYNWLLQQFPRQDELARMILQGRKQSNQRVSLIQQTKVIYYDLRQWIDPAYVPLPHIRNLEGAYSPHPFQQAIKVARAAGDDETASALEIRRRRIEGRLSARALRPSLAMLGLIVSGLWFWSQGANSMFEVAAGILIGGSIALLADIAQRSQDLMFGYLQRPTRSVATLLAFFLIGWVGVHQANSHDRMVISLTPTASVVDGLTGERLGSPVGSGTRSAIRCGNEINELLYAVDLFIPLIDLHQEDRCSVGDVDGSADLADRPRLPAIWNPGGLAQHWQDLTRRTVGSATFWEIMKAIYGVIGWVIISLSILTFTHSTRKSGPE